MDVGDEIRRLALAFRAAAKSDKTVTLEAPAHVTADDGFRYDYVDAVIHATGERTYEFINGVIAAGIAEGVRNNGRYIFPFRCHYHRYFFKRLNMIYNCTSLKRHYHRIRITAEWKIEIW